MKNNTYPKEKNKKLASHYKRMLHIKGEKWSYKIAGTDVYILSSNRQTKYKTSTFEASGTTEDAFWSEQDEYSSMDIEYPTCTPKDIKIFIINNIFTGKQNGIRVI